MCELVLSVAGYRSCREEALDMDPRDERPRAHPGEARVEVAFCKGRYQLREREIRARERTEEAPFRAEEGRDFGIRVDDDWALWISAKLGVEGAEGLDKPVVVLEETAGS